eukprot:scaffold1499_cov255-Pinguiococcus_pyrenoidosus.AAC.37
MAFTVWNGWKLGVIEAVIYVMVVGLSVDYTVHLSDAYLESNALDRQKRTQEMLFKMGVSVVSGAISTFGASLFLLAPYVTFFPKFGSFLAFVVAQSLTFSLFFFTAALHHVGPEHRRYGESIKRGQHVKMHDDLQSYLSEAIDPLNHVVVDPVATVRHAMEDDGTVLLTVFTSKGRKYVKASIYAVRVRSQSGDVDVINDLFNCCKRSFARRKEELLRWYLAKETVVLADRHTGANQTKVQTKVQTKKQTEGAPCVCVGERTPQRRNATARKCHSFTPLADNANRRTATVPASRTAVQLHAFTRRKMPSGSGWAR